MSGIKKHSALRYKVTVVAIVAAFVGALGISTSAQASVSTSNCVATAMQPAPVRMASNGTKQSAPKAVVRCAVERRIQVNVLLYGEDFARNDLLANSYFPSSTTYATFRGGNVPYTVTGGYVGCNEDSPGADELFSTVRIRVGSTSGVWSPWTGYDKGITYSYSC